MRPTKHDKVLRLSVQISLIEVSREDFDITAPAINLLLVFHGELDHKAFALVAEGLKPCRGSIEAGILAGLQTLRNKKKKKSKLNKHACGEYNRIRPESSH